MVIQAKFPRGWWGTDLPGYRDAEPTFGYFDYDGLPPLNERLDGSFAWLSPLDPALRKVLPPSWSEAKRSQRETDLVRVQGQASRLGFALPEAYLRFMRSEELQRRIPSCTACFFDVPERVVMDPETGLFIRFMNDQQGCVLWYLYLEKTGAHAVVASTSMLDSEEDEEEEGEPQFVVCAADFEEFLYRTWIENVAWFVLTENHRGLSPAEQRYLDHYRT